MTGNYRIPKANSRIPKDKSRIPKPCVIPDLIGGSHHRDPRVKPEDDIVGNSRIPK